MHLSLRIILHSGTAFYHTLLTMIIRLSGYLLLTLGLLPALVLPFEQVVWASENTTVLSSPYFHRLWDNDKRLPATRATWKEVDLAYERLFPYDQFRQPHPPAGCVVLPAISHNSYKQSTGITTRRAILMLRCRERIDLLRPARWVRSRLRAQNRQGYLLVSMPEMGIMDVQVHVVAVRSSAFNPVIVAMKSVSSRPVIGLFIHHTTNVRQYTFKDTLTGKIDTIRATPNHPFYVVNQQRYIPVSHLSTHDQLINVLGHVVILVCPKGKTRHCGQPYHPGQVIPVYNLEVYGQHWYFVGEPGLMVHNGYGDYQCITCQKRFRDSYELRLHKITHTDDKPFPCKICGKRFNNPSNLKKHIRIHSGERSYRCDICKKAYIQSQHLKRHFASDMHIRNEFAARSLNTPTDTSSAASASTGGTKSTRARFRSPLTKLFDQEIAKFCGDVTPGKVSDYFDIPDSEDPE